MQPNALLIGVEDSPWEVVAHDLIGHLDTEVVSDGDGVLVTSEGSRARARYAEMFRPESVNKRIEIAPNLLVAERSEMMASRARLLGPDVRIIVVLNHPVDRIRRHHLRLATAGQADTNLSAALQMQSDLVDDSRYEQVLAPWFERFAPWAIHVIVAEEYLHRPANAHAALCAHLSLDPQRVQRGGRLRMLRRAKLERWARTPKGGHATIDGGRLKALGFPVGGTPSPAVPSRDVLAWLLPELRADAHALAAMLDWDDQPWDLDAAGGDIADALQPAPGPDLTDRVDLTGPTADLRDAAEAAPSEALRRNSSD